MKKVLYALVAMMLPLFVNAQRFTDKLDRGLIAQKTASGVLVSWRILGEEYYDVQYNVYRDGTKINESPLDASNFMDASGSTSSTYTVAPVVKGKEQAQSKGVKPWSSSYFEISLAHEGIASTLVPNDACCADVDGDGELEILMKFDNESEMAQSYPKNGPVINGKSTYEYSIFEVFKLNGKRLWWVNCGPNMGDFQNNEQNIVGYDWNQDGKAEVLMRLLEGSTIHYADGTTYTIGANGQNGGSWYNYRGATGGGVNWFMHDGKEFLVYCNGETGKIYDIIDYPLARLEPGETSLEAAWGDGYGHRCSKFFFGAPYLDGRHPSIFLARGIYTQIKMCAFDVNTSTNKLVKRWDWRQTAGGYWMWQGYHNFGVADVDMDGRDEICYGSMVVDDNGKGLSTTGLGHGDAQHCGDFNPYIHGLEIYACNEDQPGNNYRDATTSKIYHRYNSGNDDGRAMMDNFSDQWPGAIGCSAREGAISSVTNNAVSGMGTTGINTNFRIYWDGDLCSETFNYLNGKNTEGCVAKYGSWTPIYTAPGSMTNNDTKGTPCYQGDILGDWREEIIMRTASNNIRIYSTPTPTEYRVPTLWADHQYRNAMVWQMCGYNQPPHISYFLGKLEGITVAPPPLTMTGRTEVANGGIISSSLNGKHVIVCEAGNTSVSIGTGAQPEVLTFNVPSWVQGTAGTNYTAKDATINYEYYTCTVKGGGITGDARLVKQGDGTLVLPKTAFTHTGNTDVWEGVLNFDGTMANSALWLNRFTELNSDGGQFKSITAQYDAKIRPGGKGKVGTITVAGDLYLDYGSRLVVDVTASGNDVIKAKNITIIKKTGTAWTTAGPEFIQPVLEVNVAGAEAGDYVIAECETVTGSLANVKVVGVSDFKTGLKFENGKVILTLGGTRGASNVEWTGAVSNVWNYATAQNFVLTDDAAKTPDVFVHGDVVNFNDNAQRATISLAENVRVGGVVFANETKNISLAGSGSITEGSYEKEGAASVTISTMNSYKGGNHLRGGTTVVSALSNDVAETGNLGAVTSSLALFTMENGAVLQTNAAVTNGSPIRFDGELGGVINNSGDFVQQKTFYGTLLTKKGSGWLKTRVANTSLKKLVVNAGTLEASGNAASTIELQGSAALTGTSTSSTIQVTGSSTKFTTANRTGYSNALTGKGKITVYCATEKGSNYYATRTNLAFRLNNFEGTLIPHATYTADGRFTFDTSTGSNMFTLDIPAGIIVQNSGKTLAIGNVTGSGTLGGGCAFSNGVTVPANTWNVGNDQDFTFPGVYTSGDNFNKVGTGKMTVSGVWNSSGAVNVNEGAIVISTGCLGTGKLTVANGATLMGTTATSGTEKIIKNSSVVVNGTLMPGKNETTALTTSRMLFNNQDVTINKNGTLRMMIRQAAVVGTATSVSGNNIRYVNKLTLNGKVSLKLIPASTWTPAVGDAIRLWTDVKSVVGTPTVSCDIYNGKIYSLDSSRLSEGLLFISQITPLGDVDGDGYVTMSDANMVVNYFLGVVPTGFNAVAADVDQDGSITMSDANAIVNIFLGSVM